ncbi:MAG: cation:proton antiporter [Actinobacteria bacterium]|nr:MAG: cation:proton antiporter [Actinomycetota bacterium]
MSFGTLLVVVLAGLAGPALALGRRRFVPVVIGEILAGVIVGRTGIDAIDPSNGTLGFLGQVGFAMLMLTVGMHLPLRDRRLLVSLRSGAALALIAGLLAVPAAFAAAAIAGTAHVAVYAVLLASGSAAVLLPALEEAGPVGLEALAVMAQVTIADVVTILSVPIVLQPSRTAHAALGAALVALASVVLIVGARRVAGHRWVRRARELSWHRRWALDLRLSLLVLFLLTWISQKSGTSALVAGFGAGVTVALAGGPRRLSNQMRGVADGFFIPLYFVVLGAQLDLRGLVDHPEMLALAGALAALNVAIHIAAAALLRRPLSGGLVASAQLGVPAAVASLGLAEHVLSRGVATAIVAAAMVSLLACTAGIEALLRSGGAPSRPARAADAAPAKLAQT